MLSLKNTALLTFGFTGRWLSQEYDSSTHRPKDAPLG